MKNKLSKSKEYIFPQAADFVVADRRGKPPRQ